MALALGSAALNVAYFICGLYDARISNLAKQRHNQDGYWVDLWRMGLLVGLQMLFYLSVGLGSYTAF